jgi:hypothetical protein
MVKGGESMSFKDLVQTARTENKVALAGRVGAEIEAVLLWEAHGV